jgi:hypothetical protein
MSPSQPEASKRQTRRGIATPEEFPQQSPPAADPSTHDLTIGKLTEAVETLKKESRDNRDDLRSLSSKFEVMSKEHHGWKVGYRVLLGVGVVVAGFLGWAITSYLNFIKK